MSNDLKQRVQQYRTFELPGQPMATHMGTSYLINDLWKEVERLRAELDTLKATPPSVPDDEYVGWYCSHCQCGVDASEVTYHEQHTVCGRVITHDRPPSAPDGWQLVPVEPTPEMLDSSLYPQSYLPLGGSNEANRLRRRAQKIYTAMLAAAPTQLLNGEYER